jgi:Zn finger protein HypA/HybF involved in hydrogenase expression
MFLSEMKTNHPTLEVRSLYVNTRTKVDLTCTVCGLEFSATAGSLYMKHGCPKCHGYLKKTHEEFIEEMSQKNPKIIVLGNYENNHTKIDVKCKECGYEWQATPNSLLSGGGCGKCYGHMRRTTEEFQDELHKIYPTLTVIGEYINKETPIECRCEICGLSFTKIPHSMLRQRVGCPSCTNRKSKGEQVISRWLTEHNIEYITSYSISDCKDINPLPFDFYLPNFNMLIEYDGIQHYEVNEFFGGEKGFNILNRHDEIKTQYCKDNKIELLRIPYWDFENINQILETKLII